VTKKFTINCDFGGQMSPFAIFIGKPEKGHHPLHFQADWLSKARGGMIPGEVMEAVTQLQELAEKNGVALEDLCVYALGTEKQQSELEGVQEEDNIQEESFVEEPHDGEEMVEEANAQEEEVEQEFPGESTEEESAEEESAEEELTEEESTEEKKTN
jgi:hypothetical protein